MNVKKDTVVNFKCIDKMASYIVGKDYTEEERCLEEIEKQKYLFSIEERKLLFEMDRWCVLEQNRLMLAKGQGCLRNIRECQSFTNNCLEKALEALMEANQLLRNCIAYHDWRQEYLRKFGDK